MAKHFETVIIGAGQAGLATSYYLAQRKRNHIILEQAAQAANQWRNQRWDSFSLVTPNWTLQMPGAAYKGANPDGFLSRQEVAEYFEQYAQKFRLPVQYNTRVMAVELKDDNLYHLETTSGQFTADNVVIATGFFQEPKYPVPPASIANGIMQLHTSQYKNPAALPAGAVLVVGSGQSGCQVAEELNESGRKVFLSIGSAGRAPRRYRGRDIIRWLFDAGFFELTPEQLPPGMNKFGGIPHLSGTNGGHTINLHQLARNGVQLLGHLTDAKNTICTFAPDMPDSLAKADFFEKNLAGMIDGFIQANAIPAPVEELPQLRDGFDQKIITELDLQKEGINTVIWATGYWFDYSLVKLPVLDNDGFPVQNNGMTKYEGLYFVGMPWMPSEKSGFLAGVGEAARVISYRISERGNG